MTKKVIIFTLLATLLTVISGCQGNEQSPATQKPATTKETAQPSEQNQTASLKIMEEEATQPTDTAQPGQPTTTAPNTPPANDPAPTTPPSPALTETDLAAYQGALQLMDETFCDKITDETAKTECKTQIIDQKTLNTAITALDATQCENMSTDDKKEACKTQVEVAVKQKENAEQKDEDIQKQAELSSEIEQSGDYMRCKELTDPNFIKTCELNILSKKAVELENENECQKATDEETRERCNDIFQTLRDLNQ